MKKAHITILFKSRHLKDELPISLSATQVTLLTHTEFTDDYNPRCFPVLALKLCPLPSFIYAVEFLNTVVGHYVYSSYILYFESQSFFSVF